MRSSKVFSGDWDPEFIAAFDAWWRSIPDDDFAAIRGVNAMTKYQDGLIWCMGQSISEEITDIIMRSFRDQFPDGKMLVFSNTAYFPEVVHGDQGSSDSDAQDRGEVLPVGDEGGRGVGDGYQHSGEGVDDLPGEQLIGSDAPGAGGDGLGGGSSPVGAERPSRRRRSAPKPEAQAED